MEKAPTIIEQDERIKLNTIACMDDNHTYEISNQEENFVMYIKFIKGGRNTPDCKWGITHEELMRIIIHRMEVFEDQFGGGDNLEAIEHAKKALEAMEKRTYDRLERGVLGNSGEDYARK